MQEFATFFFCWQLKREGIFDNALSFLLAYICLMFVEIEMLVYCNTEQFLSSSFFKSEFMIGKYLIFIGFCKAHEFTVTRIEDHNIVIEPVV